jgi:hypothetical protein
MGLRSVAISNLESAWLARNKIAGGLPPAASGKVAHGPYKGQTYFLVAARHGWPSWYRVILTDERGRKAERDIRESFL